MTTPELRFPNDLDVWLKTDTVMELGAGGTPLQRVLTGAAITAGNVTGEIWNQDATPNPAKVGDITFSHDDELDGHWIANVDDDFESSALLRGMNILTKITAIDGAGYTLYAEIPGVVRVYRGEES
jgi:hypothetical protein